MSVPCLHVCDPQEYKDLRLWEIFCRVFKREACTRLHADLGFHAHWFNLICKLPGRIWGQEPQILCFFFLSSVFIQQALSSHCQSGHLLGPRKAQGGQTLVPRNSKTTGRQTHTKQFRLQSSCIHNTVSGPPRCGRKRQNAVG